MTEPTVLIQFDRETLEPSSIFFNGATDTETARLQEIIGIMLKAVPDREVMALLSEMALEEPEP